MFSRRWVLTALLAGAAVPGCAEAPARSPRPAARPGSSAARSGGGAAIVDAAGVAGTVGFVVMETASGKILEGMNDTLAQPPASVAKAVTGFTALI